jgi:hypothetical protein
MGESMDKRSRSYKAQVIEEVHGGHPPASLKLAMFSLLPYLEESKTWFPRSLFQTENQVQSSFHPRLFACIRSAFHIALLLCSTLSTFASMKSGKSPIAIARKVRYNSPARSDSTTYAANGIVGRLVEGFTNQNLRPLILNDSF